MKNVIIHSEAIAELDKSVDYYQEQQAGLGLDFLTEVEQAIDKIRQNPNIGSPYKISGLRRYILKYFPYLIF